MLEEARKDELKEIGRGCAGRGQHFCASKIWQECRTWYQILTGREAPVHY